MADALVVGCGFVGSELARRLQLHGRDVAAVTRTGTSLAGVDDVPADVTDPDLDLPQAQVVFYLVSSHDRTAEAYRRVHVDGVRNVARAVDAPIVKASSTSVFGHARGAWVDEGTPPDPASDPARVLLEGEDEVLERGGVVVRFAGLYGPGRNPARRYTGEGTVRRGYVNLIHRDDAATAIQHAAFAGDHDLYVAVDDEPVDKHDLARWIHDRTGGDLPDLIDEARRPNKRCSNQRLRGEGWEPAYPTFREGLKDLL